MKTAIKIVLVFILSSMVGASGLGAERDGGGNTWQEQAWPRRRKPIKTKTIQQVRAELEGKSKAEVKAYFGRRPDAVGVNVETDWRYKMNVVDPDSERMTSEVWISFNGDSVLCVCFFQ